VNAVAKYRSPGQIVTGPNAKVLPTASHRVEAELVEQTGDVALASWSSPAMASRGTIGSQR